MGNVWSAPCDPPVIYMSTSRRLYNWNRDIGKQVNATLHWAAKWEKTHTKPHRPSFLHLRWLGCPAAGECRKAHWWTKERRCSAVGREDISFFPPNLCILSYIHAIRWILSHEAVATFSCLAKDSNNKADFQKRVKKREQTLKLGDTYKNVSKLL